MKHLIPIPHADNIPPYEDRESFCQMLDDIFGGIYKEIVGLLFLNDPLRCPSAFLDALVEMAGGETSSDDTETSRRIKAYNAQNHEFKKSLWKSVKNLIDGETGADAAIYSENVVEDCVRQSFAADILEDGWKVAVTQALSDYSGFNYGVALYSYENKWVSRYQVKIDVGAPLDQEAVDRILKIIAPQLSAYITVVLGWFDGINFITYKEIF